MVKLTLEINDTNGELNIKLVNPTKKQVENSTENELLIAQKFKELFDTKLPNAYQVKYYQDLVNRTIWINEEINGDLTYELIHYITKWNREDKGIPEEDRKPIKLLFDSPGGELDA